MCRNLRLTLQYEGTDFHGFQRQEGVPTVQEAIEAKLARITGVPVRVVAAGRTDAGVHATGQVINFHTECAIPAERLAVAVNSLPPYTVLGRCGAEVEPSFHARFDARSRSYRYLIWRGEPSPFLRRYAWRIPRGEVGQRGRLDLERMREGAGRLVGEHDFRAFCAAGTEVGSTVRRIDRLTIRERAGWVSIDVTANGFLQQMVRIVVGTLIEVAHGRREPHEISQILASGDRKNAGPTAPAHGLYLTRVTY
jgi:tRNA pseudouridine38-40 synthase